MNIQNLVVVAQLAAQQAGRLAHEQLTQERKIDAKGYRDIVTDADIAAQHAIVDIIRAQFPDHGFLTEEEDATLPATGPIIWIIDPIDGTTNYSRQLPVFCISIAATVKATNDVFRTVAAAVYDPLRNELYSAGSGLGTYLNGQPVRVSATARLSDAVFAADFGHSASVRRVTIRQVSRLADEVTTVRAFGSAVLAMAWVASGRLDAYLNNALKPWDLAAGWLLIEEAGGQVSTLDGSVPGYDDSNYPVLGSNGWLHEESLMSIRQ